MAFSGLICLFLALPATAQHRGAGGGGGGSRPSGGGGGGGFSRPSGGNPGGGFSRPSGGSRPSSTAIAPPRQDGGSRGARPSIDSRPGTGSAQARPNGTFQSRPNVGGNRGVVGPRAGVNGARPYVGRGSYPGRGNYGRYGYGYRGGNYGRYGYGYRGGYRYYGPRYFNYGFYNYRGYYNTYYGPHIGFSIGVLPFGYYPFWYGDYQYYYSDGLYYQQSNDQYTVVEPPIGAQVNTLPSKAEPITINGEQYYEQNGVYYRQVTKDDGTSVYEVAGKDGELNTPEGDANYQQFHVGDVVKQLPEDSRKITVNGEKLFVAPDGTYFQEQRDGDNNKVYKVVGLATEEPADEN